MVSTASPIDKLVIHDNFYEFPDAVRNSALEKHYAEPPPFTPRLARTAACDENETQEMLNRLGNYLSGETIEEVNIVFRYSLADAQKKIFCHVDGCSYAGILYLSLPEDCAGGTSIFRHKQTGDEIFKREHSHLYDFRDAEQWELIKAVDMAYNRLVMYPGQLFHSITPVFFGDDIQNARLTQNVFIQTASGLDV